MITLISNHIEQAKDRLREQYKGKPTIEALITAWVGQVQELEQILIDLSTQRSIDTASGIQLDLIGELLNKPRNGRSDADYRILLLAKIAQNISRGTPEDVIAVFKILTSSSRVQLGDGHLGEIYLLADHVLSQDEVNFILQEMIFVDSAAVRIQGVGSFEPDDSFAFDGSNLAKGFGSIYDVTKGGKFATIKLRNDIKFAFFGSNDSQGGFSSIYDNQIGGSFDHL
jgi:hypothetical protein